MPDLSNLPEDQVASTCGPYAEQTVTGSLTGGTVWGSNPYTDDSDFARAAVHAGLCQPGETITIQKRSIGQINKYIGSIANGVTTQLYTSPWCGVVISKKRDKLPSSGQIKMSQIRTEFLDSSSNNRLNEYGGGETGLSAQNKGSGTQRKFSDYYNKEFKIVKEVTTPATQSLKPTTGGYRLERLFTEQELSAPNDKVINIVDTGVPIGLTPDEHFTGTATSSSSGNWRSFELNLSNVNISNEITINNYAKMYGIGGGHLVLFGLPGFPWTSPFGGDALHITGVNRSNTIRLNNYGEIRAGGGAGGQGSTGGEGQYVPSGTTTLTKSSGGRGGTGGRGRGYSSTAPYFTNIAGQPGEPGTNNAGSGGRGGDGGDWAEAGKTGSPGTAGVIGGTQSLQNLGTITYSIGAGGQGGIGSGVPGNGQDGGTTTLTIGNLTFTAPGGGGGSWSGIGGSGSGFLYTPTVTNSGGTPILTATEIKTWLGGNGRSSSFGGGGGGSIGEQHAQSNSSPLADLGNPTSTIEGSIGSILVTKITSSLGGPILDPTYASPFLNASVTGGYTSGIVNGTAIDGGSPARWGGGGGGGGYGGANGGNGNLGGGGGGAAGANSTSTTVLWWRQTNPGTRTLTDALSRSNAHYISVMVRQGFPWGDSFEANEGLDVQYSLNNGSTWTGMAYISTEIGTTGWHTALYKVPQAARGSGVRFRINQRPWSSNLDQWAVGPAKIHYQNGNVDVLWTPASIPGTFWYVTGTQDVDYTIDRSNRAPGYSGTIAPAQFKGGDGGSGFIIIGLYKASLPAESRYTYNVITSGSGSLNYTNLMDYDAVFIWVVGGGGGGGGAFDSVSDTGGGGASGSVIFASFNKISGSVNANTSPATVFIPTNNYPGAAIDLIYKGLETYYGSVPSGVDLLRQVANATLLVNNAGTITGNIGIPGDGFIPPQ